MVTNTLPQRSALYVPASNQKALANARRSSADIVIVDLEDAVVPTAKADARANTVQLFAEGGFGHRQRALRVNSLSTPWGVADLAAATGLAVDVILIPKVNGPTDIVAYDTAMASTPASLRIWAMIETCEAVLNLPAIAGAARTSRLSGLVLGTNDLGKEMRARNTPDRAPLLPALAQTVVAARAYGLTVLDGVCNELDDLSVFRVECIQGRTFGCDGKTLIHPRQIDICNEIYSPQPDEIAWAEAVIEAFSTPENAGKGAIKVAGQMVEMLHLEQAQRIRAAAQFLSRGRVRG